MSGIPATYLTLKSTNPGANQAQWVFGNNLITTKFEKVRFYPNEMRIGTGDFTFSESYNSGVDPEDYFINRGPGGCVQPLPAAGTSATDPDLLSVPFGVVGLCNAIQDIGRACPYPLPDPAPTPKANIDLTGTGLRLINNPGMDFLYYEDPHRAQDFDENGTYANTSYNLTPPGTTNFTDTFTIMNSHVEHRPDWLVDYVGFCQWVTTEAWMGDARKQGVLSLAPRSFAIRSGKGSICVCADTSNNADCNKTCNYNEKDIVFPSPTTTSTITTSTTTTSTTATSTTATSSSTIHELPDPCQNMIDRTPGVPDGEYNISVNNQQYSVYCHNMSGIPATYLTLKSTNPGANQAQWVFGNNLITTKFEKVRFYPNEMRIGTGDFTFSESYNSGVDPEDYFINRGPGGCVQPLPAAGTSATDPDLLSVPFGVVGLCNAILKNDPACPYPLPDPAPTPKANIDLTGTGLRLIDNPGMDFLYYEDSVRADAFNENGAYFVSSNHLTPPGTTNFTDTFTIMNSHVEHRPDFFVDNDATGFCQWVTTEAWMGDARKQDVYSLAPRSLAIRSGKGSICVCADTSNNADCNKACSYDEKDIVFPPPSAPEAPLAPKEEAGVSVGMIVGIVAGAIVVLGIGTAICVKSRYSGYTKTQLMDSL